jgi:uncharacterized protein (DUF3820 family)
MTIEQNIHARQLAEAAIALAADYLRESSVAKIPAKVRLRYWRLIAEHAAEEAGLSLRSPTNNRITPMTDDEARTFGGELMPFGQHRGVKVDHVPIDYLQWLVDERDKGFQKRLQRYLLSSRVQCEERDR